MSGQPPPHDLPTAPGVDAVATTERAADFAALYAAADFGVARIDAATLTVIDANPPLAAMLGYARNEVVGMALPALIVDVGSEGVGSEGAGSEGVGSDGAGSDGAARAAFRAALRTDGAAARVTRLRARDGRAVPVRIQASVVRDAAGRAVRLLVLVRDLTAERAAAATAFDDRERTRLALTAAHAGAWEFRIADATLIWSPGLAELYDLPPGAPAPDYAGWQALIHPDDLDRAVPRFAAGDGYSTEFRVAVDGGWRWIGARGQLLRDAGGAPERVVGINIDLSEPRAAVDAAALAAGRFRAAVEAMAGVLWTNSPDGRMVGEQPGWAALTGQTQAEYRDFGWATAVHPDDGPATVAEWHRAVAEARPFAFQHRVRVRGGSWRWFSIRAIPVTAADGAIVEWVGVHTDIDDAHVAETALKARVAAAVGAREVALAQLHEAQKLETIGQLTGGVAHDFNNLLTPIIGSLDLLARADPDARAKRLIEGALTAADRARLLVQRLLAFARRQALESRAVDVAQLVDGIRDLIDRSIGPAIAVVVDAGAAVPAAMVDPAQLELAVLNLCVNARDAMPDGGTLTIAVDAAGDHVRLTVGDTGTGMDEATRRRAIEPFFSTKGVGHGTGLGLSMVDGLAAQSGGRLVIDSAPGCGTRATLWLPVAAAGPAAPPPPRSAASPTLRRERILLVDDEAMVRATTAAMLADFGYAVVEADGARAALAELDAGAGFDLLVTDYLMPETNGADLVRAARARRPGLAALLVTGFADAVHGPELPRLAKPFRHDDLGAAVAAVLDAR